MIFYKIPKLWMYTKCYMEVEIHMVHIDSEINVNRLENIAKTLSTSMFRLLCK